MATEKVYIGTKEVAVLTSAARTASGYSDAFLTNGYSTLNAALKVTADTALTSLDVSVKSYDPTLAEWITIGSFTQVTTTPSTAENLNITASLRGKCRIDYALVGTSATFAVGIVLRQ